MIILIYSHVSTIYIYIYVYIHTYMHAYIHTYIHTCQYRYGADVLLLAVRGRRNSGSRLEPIGEASTCPAYVARRIDVSDEAPPPPVRSRLPVSDGQCYYHCMYK